MRSAAGQEPDDEAQQKKQETEGADPADYVSVYAEEGQFVVELDVPSQCFLLPPVAFFEYASPLVYETGDSRIGALERRENRQFDVLV